MIYETDPSSSTEFARTERTKERRDREKKEGERFLTELLPRRAVALHRSGNYGRIYLRIRPRFGSESIDPSIGANVDSDRRISRWRTSDPSWYRVSISDTLRFLTC